MLKLLYAMCWRNYPATKYHVTIHTASMSGKLNSNSCKWFAEHFSTGLCKSAKFSVQIIEKWQGNGRTSHGAVDLGEAVLRRKRETEWMLKLRTLYPYGLNEKMDICEDGKNVKRFKSDDGIVMMDPSIPRLFQRDQAYVDMSTGKE